MKIYIDPNGTQYPVLPNPWQNHSPMTDGIAVQLGWTVQDVTTVADYDNAMEAHLAAERNARGYTTRSPIEYTNSTNPRWAQDAKDWQAHLDAVMNYGLEVMNKYEAGEPVPTLEEFKAALPVIQWTVTVA